ncbi:hypothetical protein S726_005394, partial [Salmonella enterica subsp. enterica]|nr:hypothetical protein [Salmonella enterica subsp. enterica]
MKSQFAFRWATLAIVMSTWMSTAWGGGLLGGDGNDTGSVAVGYQSLATTDTVAIGSEARSENSNSVAIGSNANTGNRTRNTAIGSSATIGYGASNSVAIGEHSTTSRNDDVSIGAAGQTRTLSNLTDGTDAHDAVNKGQLDSAIAGISGGVSAEEAQKMADTAQSNAVSAANGHTDTEINNVLNSGRSTAKGGFSIGEDAQATGDYSTSTGIYARATGPGSTATGTNALASGMNSTATGISAYATADNSTATGPGTRAEGNSSTATGAMAYATGVDSTATGHLSFARGKNSVALGANAVAKKDNEVNIGIWAVIGSGGAANTQTGTRTLSGLSDGVNSDEAVNKGQLDTAKASAISEANKYTGDEIGNLDTKAQGYATTAQTAANKHTDDEIGKLDTKAQGYATTAQT